MTDQDHESDAMPFKRHWKPAFRVAFWIFLTVRVLGAAFSPIADCDETFNYWEPTHYLVYGNGFQTWEYSPEFALRPYLYIVFHAAVVWIAKVVAVNKVAVFYLLRYTLALVAAFCQSTFYESVTKRFKGTVGVHYLLLSVLSIGPFFASVSYLPSSFAMYCFLLSFAAWFEGGNKDKYAVLWGLAGVVLSGWPFCAVAAVPMALHIFYRQGLFKSIWWGMQGAVITLVPQILTDSYFYGKMTCSICNLVAYNTKAFFGANRTGDLDDKGPLLYGTEPWYFYFLNMLLNFGPLTLVLSVGFLAFVAIIFILVHYTTCLKYWPDREAGIKMNGIPLESSEDQLARERKKWRSALLDDVIYTSPLVLWLVFMIPQAHKEERFLFVVYPMITLAAAIITSRIQEIFEIPSSSVSGHVTPNRSSKRTTDKTLPKYKRSSISKFFVFLIRVVVPICLLLFSATRLFVLSANSTAPTKAFVWLYNVELNDHNEKVSRPVNICVGREWHRFPSSFFLVNDRIRLKFVRSAFEGELPQPYLELENGTSAIQAGFNDENKLEPNRYIEMEQCSYLVDMELVEQKEPRYAKDTKHWTKVYSEKALDLAASKKFWRTFCLPGIFGDRCVYGDYYVLKRRRGV